VSQVITLLNSYNCIRRLGSTIVGHLACETELGSFNKGDKICDAELNPPFLIVPLNPKVPVYGLKKATHGEPIYAAVQFDYAKISKEAYKRIQVAAFNNQKARVI
jgi:hypothetical protein